MGVGKNSLDRTHLSSRRIRLRKCLSFILEKSVSVYVCGCGGGGKDDSFRFVEIVSWKELVFFYNNFSV